MRMYRSRHFAARFLPPIFRLFIHIYLRIKVEGAEKLPTEGSFIIVANHNSHADTAAILAALPRHARKRFVAAAAKDYFFQGGPWQFLSRVLFNAIPISRDRRGGQDPLRHAARALREGYALLLFPEGTRSKDGTVGPFLGGVGRLIADFPGTPVVPTYLFGTAEVMPKGAHFPRPHQVTVRFGDPIQIKAHPRFRATWRSAAEELREAVLQVGGVTPPSPPPATPAPPAPPAPE